MIVFGAFEAMAIVVFRFLGAGHAFGWFGVALGVSLVANRIAVRWWSFRAGVTAD
jgi:hypothetical protein